jgi:hypothetical protein
MEKERHRDLEESWPLVWVTILVTTWQSVFYKGAVEGHFIAPRGGVVVVNTINLVVNDCNAFACQYEKSICIPCGWLPRCSVCRRSWTSLQPLQRRAWKPMFYNGQYQVFFPFIQQSSSHTHICIYRSFVFLTCGTRQIVGNMVDYATIIQRRAPAHNGTCF